MIIEYLLIDIIDSVLCSSFLYLCRAPPPDHPNPLRRPRHHPPRTHNPLLPPCVPASHIPTGLCTWSWFHQMARDRCPLESYRWSIWGYSWVFSRSLVGCRAYTAGLGSRVAEVAGYNCYGCISGIRGWEGSWRAAVEGEEDRVCLILLHAGWNIQKRFTEWYQRQPCPTISVWLPELLSQKMQVMGSLWVQAAPTTIRPRGLNRSSLCYF